MTWNETCEVADGSYSISDIQDYFKHVSKTSEKVTNKAPIRI